MSELAQAYAEQLATVTPAALDDKLSIGEREVIALMANGKSQAEIAHTLKLKPDNVRAILVRARHKTGARTREHLVALWVTAKFKSGRVS